MDRTSKWLLGQKSDENKSGEFNQRSKIISLVSGKGGTGKTLLSLKLAMEASRNSNRVLVVDCDYNLSSTMIKLGIPYKQNKSYLHNDIKSCIIPFHNFDLIHASQGSVKVLEGKINVLEKVKEVIRTLSSFYDCIVLDCPPGLNDEILKINALSCERIVVVTPDHSSVTDAYSLIKVLLVKYGIKEQSIIVNRYNSEIEKNRVVSTLSHTNKQFLGGDINFLGGLKESKEATDSFEQKLFYDHQSEEHKSFLKIYRQFSEVSNVRNMNKCHLSTFKKHVDRTRLNLSSLKGF